MRSLFQTLISYNEWANDRVLTCAEDLTEEQFTRPLESSFPTIRDTLAHLIATEWIWLHRWKGESPTSTPEWINRPTVGVLREQLRDIERERAAYLHTLSAEDLERPIRFVYLSGTEGCHSLHELLLHLVNHSTYHRGQVTTMLRQVGAAPLSTDMVIFFSDKNKSAGVT